MSKKRTRKVFENQEDVQRSVETLTQSEVLDVLTFASQYYNAYSNSNYGQYYGTYTPELTNDRLSEISLSPIKMTVDELQNTISSPIACQEKLIGYSEFLQFTDSIAKRTLKYLGNLTAFELSFNCTNIKDEREYESEEYISDREIIKDFLFHFDAKSQFKYVHRRTMEIDAFFGLLRKDGNFYKFQELPYSYCKITGKSLDWGYQFDFDMSWFLKQGLSLQQYPEVFEKMWRNVTKGTKLENYDPSNKLDKRDGVYALWSQTSSLPNKGNFVCFKFDSDRYASIPYLSAMFQDAINRPVMRALQENQYIIAAHKILVGLIPMLKDQKSGQVKDAVALSAENLGRYLGLLKRGLPDAIKISGVPFTDIKSVDFELPTKSMYNESNLVTAASSGATGSLVYQTENPSATEIRLSSEIDSMLATSVYPQYAEWLSTMVNTLTKKYKFKFTFSGTEFSENKKTKLENAIKLADKGMVDFQKIANACGQNIFEFEESLMSSAYSPIWKKLKLLPNSNTKDFGSVEGSGNVGRPMTDEPAESTERNQDRDYIG